MSTPHSIRLICVSEHNKLRIRFESYTDGEGKTYHGVYDNTYNCQFPKDIRLLGRMYEIGGDDLILVADGTRTPFYRVRKNSIRILNPDATTALTMAPENVFEVTECVICMEGTPGIIFIPCAHLCCCADCWTQLKSRKCPLCRSAINNIVVTSSS